jgi:uncharacterized membrane protein YfcA
MPAPPDEMRALDAAQAAFDAAGSALPPHMVQPWSGELVRFLTLSVLGFSCLSLLLATVLLWRERAPAQQVLKVFGIVSIVGVSAALLVAGYSNDQLTPIVGLFGAIAGYLLGKDSTQTKG